MGQVDRVCWVVLTSCFVAAHTVHALYFDWSDVVPKTALGVAVVVAALRWQKGAAAVACVLLAANYFPVKN